METSVVKTFKGSLLSSQLSDLIKFEFIQTFMYVLVICKNEEDPIKNKGTRGARTFCHYKSMENFPDAQSSKLHSP